MTTKIYPQFPSAGGSDISPLSYKGTYDAATNTPPLANGVGTNGDFYYVTVAGTNNPTGAFVAAGSSLVYNGNTAQWQSGSTVSSSTDDVIVSTNYQLEPNTTVTIGQNTTFALGSLQAQINALGGVSTLISSSSAVNVSMSNTSPTFLSNGFYSITNTAVTSISLICTGTRTFLNNNFGNTSTTLVIPVGATVVFTLPSSTAVVLLALTTFASQVPTTTVNISSASTLNATQLPTKARLIVNNTSASGALLTLPATYGFASNNFPLEMAGTNTTFLIAANSNLTLETYGSTTVYATAYGSGNKASALIAVGSSTLTALINSTTQKTPVNGEIFSITNNGVASISISSTYVGFGSFANCTATILSLPVGAIATLQAGAITGVYYILNVAAPSEIAADWYLNTAIDAGIEALLAAAGDTPSLGDTIAVTNTSPSANVTITSSNTGGAFPDATIFGQANDNQIVLSPGQVVFLTYSNDSPFEYTVGAITSNSQGSTNINISLTSSGAITALISAAGATRKVGNIYQFINITGTNKTISAATFNGALAYPASATSTVVTLLPNQFALLECANVASDIWQIYNISSSVSAPLVLQNKAGSFTSSNTDTTYSAGFIYAITNTNAAAITMTLTGTRVFANTTFGNTSTVLTINPGATVTLESISTTKLIILSITDIAVTPPLTLITTAIDITSSNTDSTYVPGYSYSVTNTSVTPVTFTCTGTRTFNNLYFGNSSTVLTIPAGATAIIDVISTNSVSVVALSTWLPLGTGVAGDIPVYDASGNLLEDSGKSFDDTITTNDNIWSAAQTSAYVTNQLLNVPTLPQVQFATTANDTLSGLAARDGYTPVAGNFALVKNQTVSGQNGVYRVPAAGAWVRQVYNTTTEAYQDISTETTYQQLNLNGGVTNVLNGTVNKNLQFQFYIPIPTGLIASNGSSVFLTAVTKIPVASPFNRFVDIAVGNNTLNNGSSSFSYATSAQALVGASFPLCVTMATSGGNDTSANTFTAAQSNVLIQSQNTTANAGQTSMTGVQTFATGSTRVHFKGTTHSTGAAKPFVFQSGAAYRNYFQSLAIITTNADWLGLHSTAQNWISLDDMDTSSSPFTAINLPAFSNAFTINIHNQSNSVLYFTGTGAANTIVNIFNTVDGVVRLPAGYVGAINWNGQAFGWALGSIAVPAGLITSQAQLDTVLAYNSDTTYDGFYAITGFTPTTYENGAIFGKQTGFGITTTWWGRKYASAPATISSASDISYQKSNTTDTWVAIGTGSGSGGHQYTNVFYMDPVDGLDTNPGTYDEPWLTITKAATAPASSVVYFPPGTYTATVTSPTNSGVAWIGMDATTGGFQRAIINTPLTVSTGTLALENLSISSSVALIATTTGTINLKDSVINGAVTINATSTINLNNCTATSTATLSNFGTLVANNCSKLQFAFTLQTGSNSAFYDCPYVSTLETSGAGSANITATNSNFYSSSAINPSLIINATTGASNVLLKNVNLYNSTGALNSGIVNFSGTTGNLVNYSLSNVNYNQADSTFANVFQESNISYFDGIELGSPLDVKSGGTGSNSLTLNNVLLGNGIDAIQEIAPNAAGSVLLSDGTTFDSKLVHYSFDATTSDTIQNGITAAGYDVLAGAMYQIVNSSTSTLTFSCTGLNASESYPANATNTSVTLLPAQMAIVECYDVTNDLFNLYNVSNQAAGGNVFIAQQTFNQTAASAVNTKINLGTAIADPLGQLSLSNSRFQPQTAGYYQLNGNVRFETNGAGERAIWIMLNGTTFIAEGTNVAASAVSPTELVVASTVYLNGTTDYVELFVYQNSGVGLQIFSGATKFSGFLVIASGGNIPSNSVAKATVATTTTQNIPNITATKVDLQSKVFDPNNWFNSTLSRFQPGQPGYYLFTGSVELKMNGGNFGAADQIVAYLYKNGNPDSYNQRYNGATADSYIEQQVSSLIYLNGSTDYVELWVKRTAGLPVVVNNNPQVTYLTCALVGGSNTGSGGGSSNYTISTGASGTITATITAAGLTDAVGATYSILNTSTTTTLLLSTTTVSGFTAFPANANITSISLLPGQSALIETEILGSKYRLITVSNQNASTNVFTTELISQGDIPDGVNTLINFVYTSDPLTQFNNANHSFQPKTAGWYQINTMVIFDVNSVGTRMSLIYKNGGELTRSENQTCTLNFTTQTISTMVYMNGTTDYLQVYAFQNSGSALSILVPGSYTGGCSFNGFLITAGNQTSTVSANFPRFGSRPAPDSLGYMFMSGENIYTCGAGSDNGGWIPYGVKSNNFTPTVAPINNTGAPITGWTDLYSDYENALALTNDGRVFSVGNLTSTNIWNQVTFPGGALISKIFSALARDQWGGISYYAIDTAGKLYSWGYNGWGQLGLGNNTSQTTPQLITALNTKTIVDVALSGNNGLTVIALDSTGQIYTWGYGGGGGSPNGSPLGNGILGADSNVPYTVLGMNNVARITAGGDYNGANALNFTRVINNDGTSWATGTNYYGVLGLGNTAGKTVFTQEVLGKTNWVLTGSLPIYRGASYAIDATGTLYFCGRNHDGCLGFPSQVNVDILTLTAPTAPFQGKMLQGSSAIKPKLISLGNCWKGVNSVAVIDNTGTLYTAGYNGVGQCGVGNTTAYITSFTKVIGIPSTRKVVDVIATGWPDGGALGMIVILDDGSMMGCGDTDYGAQGNTVNPTGGAIPVFQYVIGYAPNNI